LQNTIIVLFGFAGTGKYTIGRELARRTGAKLIDNHLINNALFTAVNADGVTPLPREIWAKLDRVRQVVYETIDELASPELSFVFTIQLIEEDPNDHKAFADLVDLAAARRSAFVPIRLICELEELCRRVVSPGRAAMLKQITAAAARQRALSKSVLQPHHPNLRTIDVTTKSALESANEILAYVNTIAERHEPGSK
jgi:hypothetical protein